ncbi:MAG: hypothetical protein HQL08_15975 [Nitrospirae bacterium]|nr:hypothetical protein [Nitrospirota bacterium]
MKRVVVVLIFALLLLGGNAFAGNGDMYVNGNVGVGTTSPQYKLDVNGAGSFEGNQIHNVGTPTAANDAATKSYVDAAAAASTPVQYKTYSFQGGCAVDATHNNCGSGWTYVGCSVITNYNCDGAGENCYTSQTGYAYVTCSK